MKRNRAVLATAAAVAASAVATVTFAPGAQAWDRCPPGNHDREYCEHHHHHHHHHHHGDGRAVDIRRE